MCFVSLTPVPSSDVCIVDGILVSCALVARVWTTYAGHQTYIVYT
jgi:hypothetical protein